MTRTLVRTPALARRTAAILAAAAGVLVPNAVLLAADDAAAVLDHVREAVGFKSLPAQGLSARGHISIRGLDGSFSTVFDNQGRFATTVDSRLPLSAGYDGKTAWEVDHSGISRVVSLGDRAEELLSTWFFTGQWLAAGTPLKVDMAPEQGDGKAVVLTLSMDEGATTGTIRIDRATWLPESFEWTSGTTPRSLKVSGYAEHAGLKLPAHAEEIDGHEHVVYDVESVETAPQFMRSPYERVVAPPPGIRFEAGAPAALEVKKAPTGHLLVKPKINGQDAGWFIFDTGAGITVISPAVADKFGLESFGKIGLVGVGGAKSAAFRQGEGMTLGPATIEKPIMTELDLSFLNVLMGEEIAGVIGYEVVGRVVAEIDPANAKVALHDSTTYQLARGQWQEMLLNSRTPVLKATFEDHEGLFTLDTGAGQSTVMMHALATERFKLLEGRKTTSSMLGGVGGMVPAKVGDLEWVELAGERHEHVKASFATKPTGAFGNRYITGNLGAGLLTNFTIILDHPHGRLALVKREDQPPAAP